jgi:agmatinase
MPAKPALLGVPYDASSSFQRGAAQGPDAIRKAFNSPSGNRWTESLVDLGDGAKLEDAGDVSLTDATMRQDVERAIFTLLERRRVPVVLGGDHSITYPVVRAFRQQAGQFTLLHFDAHPDLYPVFEGDRFSHACPFARIMEEGLVKELVQVGVRAPTGIQSQQARSYGVVTVSPGQWEQGWTFQSSLPVYLSIDLDVLDPAFAPGVSHPEPGGCPTRQLLSTLQTIQAPVIGADIVELNPINDPAGLTARVAAKLVKEVAALILRNST